MPPHGRDHIVDRRCRWHVRNRPRIARGDRPAGDEVAKQFLDVHAADDVVQITGVHGIARIQVGADELPQLVDLRADRNAEQLNPRDHGVCGPQVAELEELAQDAAGVGPDGAATLSQGGYERLLGGALERQIDRRSRNQVEVPLAVHQALDLVEGIVEEPVGSFHLPRLDNPSGIEASVEHLPRRVEARLDEVIENDIGTRPGCGEIDVRRVLGRGFEKARQHSRFSEVNLTD